MGLEKLKNYNLHIFTNGTIVFVENGLVQPPGRAQLIEGMRGAVGFGPSPNCSFNHVTAEFQIELSAAGGHSYSPDPLFWSSFIPPSPAIPPPPQSGTFHLFRWSCGPSWTVRRSTPNMTKSASKSVPEAMPGKPTNLGLGQCGFKFGPTSVQFKSRVNARKVP